MTRPCETFSIARPADIRTAILMTVVAAVVGTIAARRRQAGERARLSGEEVVGLYVTAQMLSGGARPEVVLETISEQLQALLGLSVCRFDTGRPGEHDPMINRAGDLEWRDHRWSLRFRGWPPEPVSLPIDSAGRPVGRFLLHGNGGRGHVTLDRLMTALALADLAGAALGRPGTSRLAVGSGTL